MNTKKTTILIVSGLLAALIVIVGVRALTSPAFSLPFDDSRSASPSVPERLEKEKQIVEYKFPRHNLEASYIGFGNLDDLEKHSDIIVVGTPVLPFEERKNATSHYEDGVMESFATITEFTADTVLKDPDQVVRDGQVTFYEPIAFTERTDGAKALFSIADYRELQYGNRYLVFLADNGHNGYGVINMNNGTFNMDKYDRTSGDPTHHRLMTQIFDKYDLE